MSYLMIQNPGIAPFEGLTTLGCSTTRYSENSETIGEFGSGTKYSVNVLLRMGLQPIIFTGLLKLEFFTEPCTVNDGLCSRVFNKVYVKVTGKDDTGRQINRTEKLGWTLEYGEKDWNTVNMALREFFSNAIDRSIRQTGNHFSCEMELDCQPRAKAGYTRVFIPLNSDIRNYVANIGEYFLHFAKTRKANVFGALPKPDVDKIKIYKKGVFVRTLRYSGLFDYNFDSSLTLDECRNIDDYAVMTHIAKALIQGTDNTLNTVLNALEKQTSCYETEMISDFYIDSYLSNPTVKANWNKAFTTKFGDKTVIGAKDASINEFVAHKGFKTLTFTPAWTKLKSAGIPTYSDVLSEQEVKGQVSTPITIDVEIAFERTWLLLSKYNLTGSKNPPKVACFREVMSGGSQTLGYYNNGTVYINDVITNGVSVQLLQTMLEEMVHYITGATDGSRDIQDFLFRMITEMGLKE